MGLPARVVPKGLRRRVGLPAPAVPRVCGGGCRGVVGVGAGNGVVRVAQGRFRSWRWRRGRWRPTRVPRGSVQGVVSDSVTGSGLSGVCVYLYRAAGSYAGTGTCTAGAGLLIGGSRRASTRWRCSIRRDASDDVVRERERAVRRAVVSVASGSATSPIDVWVGGVDWITVGWSIRVGWTGEWGVRVCDADLGRQRVVRDVSWRSSETYAITGMASGSYDLAFYDPFGLHPTVHATATVVAGETRSGVDGQMLS